MRSQTGPTNSVALKRVTPKYLIVPNELEEMAYRLVHSPFIPVIADTTDDHENSNTPNMLGRHLRGDGSMEVVVVDYWTDANDWFVVADGNRYPTIEVGFWQGREEPELFVQDDPTQGSNFNADKITWKIRHVYGGDILDHRTFAGGIVG